MFDDGGGDKPVSMKVELTEVADVDDVVVELSQGPDEEDWPRKLSPWYCKRKGMI